jgi:hypothetical protein
MLLYLDQTVMARVARRAVHEHERGVALYPHEDVIDVMGDASGKLSDGVHSLGVGQLLFEPFPFLRGFPSLRDEPGLLHVLVGERGELVARVNKTSAMLWNRAFGILGTSLKASMKSASSAPIALAYAPTLSSV